MSRCSTPSLTSGQTKMASTEGAVCASDLYTTKLLGLSELKELQMQVIVAFLMDQDVFAILPTGLFYACRFQYSWITCTGGHGEHNDSLVIFIILLHRANIVSKEQRMGVQH